MIKVLFVSHTSNLYGAERALLELAISLGQNGSILPFLLVPDSGPFCDCLKDHSIQFRKMRYFHWIGKSPQNRLLLGGLRFFLNLMLLPKLYLFARREQFQVIYTNTLSTPIGALLSMAAGIPHIWHIHEFVHEDMGRDFDFSVSFARTLIRRSSQIICNSKAVSQKWARFLPDDKIEVVYNGFEFADDTNSDANLNLRADRSEDESFSLLMVGSIYPHKGHMDALQAIKQLYDSGLNVKLTIVGDGDPEFVKMLQNFSKKCDIAKFIAWTGYVGHVSDYYRTHDVLLVCSRCEAFGRVAVEAIVSGIPVIATNRGGLTEIINEGRWGLTYEYGNPSMLVMQIKKLLHDYPVFRKNLIEGGRILKQRYSLSNHTARVIDLIVNTCKKGSGKNSPAI